MSGSIVGKILASVVLFFLCFIIGGQAAESAVSSALIITTIVGVVFMLIMGPRSWMLIFLMPPVISILPVGVVKRLPASALVGCGVFVYWFIMSMMGYVRMKWRSLIVIDILMVLFTILIVASYIRRPVAVAALSLDTDFVGGFEYVLFIASAIYYVALSSISMDSRILPKVLKAAVLMTLVASAINCVCVLVGLGGASSVDVQDLRIWGISVSAKTLILAIYAMFPFYTVLFNPLLLGGCIFGLGCLLMGGSRQHFAAMTIPLMFIFYIKGELKHAFFVGSLFYVLLLAFFSVGWGEKLPTSVGRILTEVPGLQLNQASERSADSTWEWRQELWSLAWDSRTGYIKDYMFGDGFGMSMKEHARYARAVMRGEPLKESTEHTFARAGLWHNGVISIVHRLGYVGLGVSIVFILILICYVLRVCISLRGTELGVISAFYLADVMTSLPMMFWGAHGADYIFTHIVSAAMLKLMYHEAKDRGLIVSLYSRRRYVPMMIEQHGNQLKNSV